MQPRRPVLRHQVKKDAVAAKEKETGAKPQGALIIAVVRVGMTFVGINIFAQQMVFGFVLIVAVAITIDRGKVLIVK